MSMFQFVGPRKIPFPIFPNVPTAGCVNKAVSSHGTQMSPGVLGHPDRALTGATPPYWLAVPMNWPRSPPKLVFDRSCPERMVSASPETMVYTPDHCQPPRAHRSREFLLFRWGRSQTMEATTRCVWSKSEGPVSNPGCSGFP